MEKNIEIFREKLGDPALGTNYCFYRLRSFPLTTDCYRNEDQTEHCD
jgi:hypothetical protein